MHGLVLRIVQPGPLLRQQEPLHFLLKIRRLSRPDVALERPDKGLEPAEHSGAELGLSDVCQAHPHEVPGGLGEEPELRSALLPSLVGGVGAEDEEEGEDGDGEGKGLDADADLRGKRAGLISFQLLFKIFL